MIQFHTLSIQVELRLCNAVFPLATIFFLQFTLLRNVFNVSAPGAATITVVESLEDSINISYALSPDVDPDKWMLTYQKLAGPLTPVPDKVGTDKQHLFATLDSCSQYTITVAGKEESGDVDCIATPTSENHFTGKLT